MSHAASEDARLMFKPFSSILNPGFWQQLSNLKLNELKLNKDPVNIHGSYSCNLPETLPCLASFDHNAFNEITESGNKSSSPLYGKLVCTNIIQEFKDYNKKEFIDEHGKEIWKAIIDGTALAYPEKHLSRFGLLVYADLKKYKFYFWFAFPAINYPVNVVPVLEANSSTSETTSRIGRPIGDVFSDEALLQLQDEFDKPPSQRTFSRGYFIVKHWRVDSCVDQVSVHPLTQFNEATSQREGQADIYFAYCDPSTDEKYPGWPLRNYLCLITVQFNLSRIKFIRLRRGPQKAGSRLELHNSIILEVTCPSNSSGIPLETPLITGWEKNESQQMAPKWVNVSNLLDPKRLAEDAVNLNLRLMKWRLLPRLDLDKIANTKCLLLGCGTLGCHIARGLLAWGVKDISILDNAKISYSNPVRQTLYSSDDCGTYKSYAAAVSLRKIHPSVNVEPYVLSIPMPGHHIADHLIEQTRKDIQTLERLIKNHDVIFLLMDTRESRWLPTVIAMSEQKLVINAAIGFDTFLLQRYGIRNYHSQSQEEIASSTTSTTQPTQLDSDKLGCYFCNDIVAPGDSTSDRTLDQQCTVSRPGVSMIVSAMAVELLASIVSSRLGPKTPAPLEVRNDFSSSNDDEYGSELGIVPHSIRGDIARYHIYMPTCPFFSKCSACSTPVINAYRTMGYEFLQKVFDDPDHLEDIAGLKDLQNISDNVWALDSDEDADDFGREEGK